MATWGPHLASSTFKDLAKIFTHTHIDIYIHFVCSLITYRGPTQLVSKLEQPQDSNEEGYNTWGYRKPSIGYLEIWFED